MISYYETDRTENGLLRSLLKVYIHTKGEEYNTEWKLPDALSPQTLHATKLFVPEDELEFESAADDVVVATVALDDDVGENGWLSVIRERRKEKE